MLISEVEQPLFWGYPLSDYTTFTITESAADWNIDESNAFRKGYKKYKNNARVVKGIEEIKAFVTSHDRNPPIKEYPPEYRIHAVKFAGNERNVLWGHLEGKKVGVVFTVIPASTPKDKNTLRFLFVGTHQQLGWN
jgi:hypothetical protein